MYTDWPDDAIQFQVRGIQINIRWYTGEACIPDQILYLCSAEVKLQAM